MKKYIILLIAAMGLVGCNHESCTVNVVNEYAHPGRVLFSVDPNCATVEEAELVADVLAGQAESLLNVKIDSLKAIVYIGTGAKDSLDQEQYVRKGVVPLGKFAGNSLVTLTITSAGYYAVKSSNK